MSETAPPALLTACLLDLANARVLRGDAVLPLTDAETRLLTWLMARPGVEVPRDALLTEVWGYSRRTRSRAVDATVQRLRGKIERDPAEPDHLQTVWGRGYRWVPGRAGAAPTTPLDLFVGREAERRAVESALGEGRRLVTLIGPSGVGKTRLARQIGAGRADAVFCALEDATDLPALLHGIGAALGAEGARREDVLTRALAARGPLLLVLDNLEQVLSPAAGLIGRLLAGTPTLRVVCTSREALAVAGERVVELGPLSDDEAVALLRDRADDARWLAPAAEESLRRICTGLDGLPLAIELAAGLAPLLSPESVLARLARPMDLLVSHRRDLPERHKSLRRAVAGAFAMLAPEEDTLLLRAAVFVGGVPLDAVSTLLDGGTEGDALEVLGRLRARSLVRPVPGREHRLGLTAAVRAYALERLEAAGRMEEAVARHRSWYAAQARARVDATGSGVTAEAMRFLDEELENLVLACRQSMAAAPEDAARLALAAHVVFLRTGPVAASVALIDACLACPGVPKALQGHLHRMRGTVALHQGRHDDADTSADAALRLAIEAGDRLLEGRAHGLAATVLLQRAEEERALPVFEAALAISRAVGDTTFEATLLGNYATALKNTDHFDAVAPAYERSLALHRAVGNRRSAAIMLGNLGLYDIDCAAFERSRARLSEALEETRRLHDRLQEGSILGHLAILGMVEGHTDEARARAEEAVALLAAVGENSNRPHVHVVHAAAAWEAGEPLVARRELERARGLAPYLAAGLDTLVLVDLLLRLDADEVADPAAALAALPPAPPWLRFWAMRVLAEGYAALTTARRAGLRECPAARRALEPLSAHPLAVSVEPFRRELGRRLAQG